jgi:hypothetical protein
MARFTISEHLFDSAIGVTGDAPTLDSTSPILKDYEPEISTLVDLLIIDAEKAGLNSDPISTGEWNKLIRLAVEKEFPISVLESFGKTIANKTIQQIRNSDGTPIERIKLMVKVAFLKIMGEIVRPRSTVAFESSSASEGRDALLERATKAISNRCRSSDSSGPTPLANNH